MKDKYDSGKHKEKHGYTSGKHKSRGGRSTRKRSRNGIARLPKHKSVLSDIDCDDTSSSLSDDEFEREVEDKVNEPCFFADYVKEGFCGMALDNGKARPCLNGDDSHSEV
jgi:hypothetical protein